MIIENAILRKQNCIFQRKWTRVNFWRFWIVFLNFRLAPDILSTTSESQNWESMTTTFGNCSIAFHLTIMRRIILLLNVLFYMWTSNLWNEVLRRQGKKTEEWSFKTGLPIPSTDLYAIVCVIVFLYHAIYVCGYLVYWVNIYLRTSHNSVLHYSFFFFLYLLTRVPNEQNSKVTFCIMCSIFFRKFTGKLFSNYNFNICHLHN